MKIAVVHSFYDQNVPSGENQIVLQDLNWLKGVGYEVKLFDRHTNQEKLHKFFKFRSAKNVSFGKSDKLKSEIQAWDPDLIHVHNLFPNIPIGDIDFDAFPVVVTLHNYRPLCAAGTFSRDGKTCFKCLDNALFGSIYRCYKSNLLQTLPLTFGQIFGLSGVILKRASAVIVKSELALEIYKTQNLVDDRWQLIPHAIEDGIFDLEPGYGFAFVGRLTEEKGILELLEKWPQKIPLTIIGDGDLLDQAQIAAKGKSVEFLGNLENKVLRNELKKFAGLVFAGTSPEGAIPLAILEAMSAGVPIICSSGNSGTSVVQKFAIGIVLGSNYTELDLLTAIEDVSKNQTALRKKSRETFLKEFGKSKWIEKMESLYKAVSKRVA